MIMKLIRTFASHMPALWQHELKRIHYRRQIGRQRFRTEEPEFMVLEQLIRSGDWVIDIGANVGHYTMKFSDLVGVQGRVIAIEPVPETFMLLTSNVSLFRYRNVTLINLAASDQTTVLGINIPDFKSGLKNYYQAKLTTQESELKVLTFALDSLAISHTIGLIKIDAEGHDPLVLQGLQGLLQRDHPTLIVETCSSGVIDKLISLGYTSQKLPGSPNLLFRWHPDKPVTL